MADEKTRKRIDDSLTVLQKFKSGFAGDPSAQQRKREEYMRQNEREAERERMLSNQNATSEALKKRLGK